MIVLVITHGLVFEGQILTFEFLESLKLKNRIELEILTCEDAEKKLPT